MLTSLFWTAWILMCCLVADSKHILIKSYFCNLFNMQIWFQRDLMKLSCVLESSLFSLLEMGNLHVS